MIRRLDNGCRESRRSEEHRLGAGSMADREGRTSSQTDEFMVDKDAALVKRLQDRIRELEAELGEREKDLTVFREELSKANIQLEKFIREIGQELKTAGLIQKTLVPTEFPNIPGFEFSTKFMPSPVSGGDYFDIFEHEDKFRFGIILASSSGYGMSALFLSVLLKMTGQLEARKGTPPDQIIELMIKELVPIIQSADLANVFYAVVDRRRFELNFSAAGKVLALLYSFSAGKLQRLEWDAGPITQVFRSKLEKVTISLGARDRLVLCSEGIVNVSSPEGEAFGEERLYKAILGAPHLGVHELRNEIFYQVDRFAQGKELQQDLTVVVTEVKDRVIKLAKGTDSRS